MKILVVDDTPYARRIHKRFLDRTGVEIRTVENGAAALTAARRAVPDVVVTDLDMPHMDGLDLCRELRADPATRNVVVVIVSGDAPVRGQAALDAGCDAVLEKPCSPSLLLETIQGLLTRR